MLKAKVLFVFWSFAYPLPCFQAFSLLCQNQAVPKMFLSCYSTFSFQLLNCALEWLLQDPALFEDSTYLQKTEILTLVRLILSTDSINCIRLVESKIVRSI